jgi:hypothetical protein
MAIPVFCVSQDCAEQAIASQEESPKRRLVRVFVALECALGESNRSRLGSVVTHELRTNAS